MLQQVLQRTRALQLVREVLSVLEIKYTARVELHLANNGLLALLGLKDDVGVQVERALSLANLVL